VVLTYNLTIGAIRIAFNLKSLSAYLDVSVANLVAALPVTAFAHYGWLCEERCSNKRCLNKLMFRPNRCLNPNAVYT